MRTGHKSVVGCYNKLTCEWVFLIFLLLFNFQCHLDHCVVTLILIVPTPLVAQSDKTHLKHPDRLVVVIMKWLIFVRAIGARRDTIQCLKAAQC